MYLWCITINLFASNIFFRSYFYSLAYNRAFLHIWTVFGVWNRFDWQFIPFITVNNIQICNDSCKWAANANTIVLFSSLLKLLSIAYDFSHRIFVTFVTTSNVYPFDSVLLAVTWDNHWIFNRKIWIHLLHSNTFHLTTIIIIQRAQFSNKYFYFVALAFLFLLVFETLSVVIMRWSIIECTINVTIRNSNDDFSFDVLPAINYLWVWELYFYIYSQRCRNNAMPLKWSNNYYA